MASVTVGRIAEVQAHINQAVILTSDRSTLSREEQDRLLEQGCAEACELLGDWLRSTWWKKLQPSGNAPLLECVARQEDFEKFLDPMFTDALARAAGDGVIIPSALVDDARKAVADTGRRFRTMSRTQLYAEASKRVGELKESVCALADQFRSGRQDAASRRKARTRLARVAKFVLNVALTVAADGPHQAAQNVIGWAHMIMVHAVASAAQPGLTVMPSGVVPGVR